MPFPLEFASRLAEKIASALSPYCDQIAVAGSIRRQRPVVNDIDLVVLQKPGCGSELRGRILQRARPITQGPDVLIATLPLNGSAPAGERQVQIDVWFALPPSRDLLEPIPGNWGSLLVCRTGSKAHNIFLCERAKKMGLKWNPHYGIYGPPGWPEVTTSARSVCLAGDTEESIFTLLGLPLIPPSQRER